MARRHRSGRSSSYGREAALRHIEEAKEFSAEIGGSDKDVKEYFFSLSASELESLLNSYGAKFGSVKELYARDAYSQWKSGSRKMSGLVAKRLFDHLPPRMPLDKKYELAGNVWKHFGPSSRHSIMVGPEAPVESVLALACEKLEKSVNEYSLPEAVQNRFRWLSSGDVRINETLLNFFRQKDRELAILKLKSEVPVLQRQILHSPDITKLAKSVINVHKHEFSVWVVNDLAGLVKEGAPVPAVKSRRDDSGANWFLYLVLGAAVFGILRAILT